MTHPDRIGRYPVVGYLAAGGMAEIPLGRLVGSGGFELLAVQRKLDPNGTARERLVRVPRA